MIKLIMIIKEILNNFFNNKKLQKKNNIDNKVNNIENKVNKIQDSIIHLENIMQEVYYKKIFSNDENYPLRIIQKRSVELLEIFDKVCALHHIKYWLDFGSLLGCVRNSQFISWDDDIDIGMTRKDFEKFYKLFLENANNSFMMHNCRINNNSEQISNGSRFIHFYIQSQTLNCSIEIFVYDYLPELNEEEFNNTKKEIINLRKNISKNDYISIKCENWDELHSNISKFDKNIQTVGNIFLAVNFGVYQPRIHNINDIFPLKKMMFEGKMFYVPNKYRTVLVNTYSDYWSLRKTHTHLNVDFLKNYIKNIDEMEK